MAVVCHDVFVTCKPIPRQQTLICDFLPHCLCSLPFALYIQCQTAFFAHVLLLVFMQLWRQSSTISLSLRSLRTSTQVMLNTCAGFQACLLVPRGALRSILIGIGTSGFFYSQGSGQSWDTNPLWSFPAVPNLKLQLVIYHFRRLQLHDKLKWMHSSSAMSFHLLVQFPIPRLTPLSPGRCLPIGGCPLDFRKPKCQNLLKKALPSNEIRQLAFK